MPTLEPESSFSSNQNRPISFLRLLGMGATFGLSLGFFDFAISLLPAPGGLSLVHELLLSLALTVFIPFILFLLGGIIVIFVGRGFRNPCPLPAMVFLGMGLGSGLVALTIYQMVMSAYDLSDTPWAPFIRVAAFGPIPLLSFLGARLIPSALQDRKIQILISISPVLSACTAGDLWLQAYLADSSRFGVSAVFTAGFVLAIGMLVWIGIKSRSRPRVLKTATYILLAIVVCPALFLLFAKEEKSSGAAFSDRAYQASERKIRRVILISVDTLRADYIHAYGLKEIPTPHIDALARDGSLFKNAISAGPWTVASFGSLLTGVSPKVHKMSGYSSQLPTTLPTLAERMRDAGYFTAAIGDNAVLSSPSDFSRGFIEYNMYPHKATPGNGESIGALALRKLFMQKYLSGATTDQITELAASWLKINRRKDFFLWVHYFTPHLPYEPPRRFIPRSGFVPKIGYRFATEMGLAPPPPKEDQDWIRALYWGEVRYTDESVGALLDDLKKLGIYDDSLIIFLSDHGEEHWDHAAMGHGHTLYNELLRVPFIVKLPHSESTGMVVPLPVTTQSLTPTVLDLCGLEGTADYFSAPPLTPLWRSQIGRYKSGPIFSSGIYRYNDADLEAVSFDHYKFIRSVRSGHQMLFDLNDDPDEMRPLSLVAQDIVRKGNDLLDEQTRWSEQTRARHSWTENQTIELPKENIQRLKALGYIR